MFDAASRLAQGRPAVETVQDYVWACQMLGYRHPDLTLHASQVRDWYGSEDGIDLLALDADCEALRAVAAATEGVLARQEAQLASMSVAWHGPGAQASRDFLRRHGEASEAVVAVVRTAAETLVSLRDRLWHSVDEKVAATIAADSRGARADWRAAAQTVTTGAGDRVTASELIDQEVKPFVDNEIRSEWLSAMRSAVAAVTDAYDAAAAELTSEVAIAFDVPGDLGPSWSPSPSDGAATAPAGANSVGAGPVGAGPIGAAPAGAPTMWSAAPSAQSMPTPLPPPPLPPPPPTGPPVEPASMAPPSLPSLGGGMPDIGSGLSGFGGQLGDLLGGLMGTSHDALSELPEIDDEPDELEELDELDDEAPDEDEDEPEAEEGEKGEAGVEETDVGESEPATDTADEPPSEESPAEPLPAAVEPVPPPPTPAPPPIEPLVAPAPTTAAGTPCEIAADELPQVGE
jgi:hypothetical protein